VYGRVDLDTWPLTHLYSNVHRDTWPLAHIHGLAASSEKQKTLANLLSFTYWESVTYHHSWALTDIYVISGTGLTMMLECRC
jgi:hypothetical protein